MMYTWDVRSRRQGRILLHAKLQPRVIHQCSWHQLSSLIHGFEGENIFCGNVKVVFLCQQCWRGAVTKKNQRNCFCAARLDVPGNAKLLFLVDADPHGANRKQLSVSLNGHGFDAACGEQATPLRVGRLQVSTQLFFGKGVRESSRGNHAM